jgi:hypothetical protein
VQLSPLAANRLIDLHGNIGGKIDDMLRGTPWKAGLLYIDGAAWVTSIRRGDEPPIEIAVDIGDTEMLLAKIGTFV